MPGSNSRAVSDSAALGANSMTIFRRGVVAASSPFILVDVIGIGIGIFGLLMDSLLLLFEAHLTRWQGRS